MSTPIMNQYKEIKALHQDYLLFFRLGDFYELFYDDAKLAASLLGITLTKRSQKNEDIPMAGVPAHTCEYYIAKLVKAGQKIAICEQTSTSENKSSSSKIIERIVTRIITPGTLMDQTLLEDKRNNFLVSIFEQNFQVSMAVFDLSTNEFFIEHCILAELKDLLEKTQPKEILLSQNFIPFFSDYETWKHAITLANPPEKTQAINKITKFFKLHSMESLSWLTPQDHISVAMILNYLELTQKYEISQIDTQSIALPKQKQSSDAMLIDKFTYRNLEITKTLQNEHVGSLLWLLDQTQTAQGGRLLFEIIHNPIKNIDELNERFKKIEFFMQDALKLEQIRKILQKIPDFDRILTRIATKKAAVHEVRNFAAGIKHFLELHDLLGLQFQNAEHSQKIEQLSDKILAAITDTPLIKGQEKGYINSGFNSDLDAWRQFENQIDSQIFALQETYKKDTKLATLRIKFTSNIGYLVEINSQHKDKLGYNFTLQQELKNTARYSNATLMQINSKFAESNDQIISLEAQILQNLCNEILQQRATFVEYAAKSAQIDVFANFALVALENGYVKPLMLDDNSFEITHGRHPVLQKILQNKAENFVPNNCDLNKCVMFMTGPNMAGKSTYLRQQALIAFLAHIGMFVPATSAKIGVVDHIFSRIGTNDNLIEGNSTFMMEMIEIALTLNQATNKSFIIFDEVGRGTSAEEGVILAQAILEYLTQDLGARAIFATHYLSLQKIEHPSLQKKMMEIIEDAARPGSIYFSHKLVDGVAKKSYAIAIAQLAGMPAKIIHRANELMK